MGFLDAPPRSPRPFTLCEASGDSYGQGVGSLDKQHGYNSILAAMLGVPLINRSIGGAVAAWPIQDLNAAGDGGWANVLQSVLTANTAAPYMPLHSLVSLSYAGFNDLWVNGRTAAIGPSISAVRLIISRYRAAAMFPYTYFSGVTNATVVGTTRFGDGLLALKSTSSGMTATFTVPADAPAGAVPVVFGEVYPSAAGTISFTVNGVHAAGNDISLAAICNNAGIANVVNGWAARFPQCVAGDVIVATITYSAGPVQINGAMIEAPTSPVIVCRNCPVVPSALAVPFGWANAAAMNADIAAVNAAQLALVGEFDSHVVYLDTVPILGSIASGSPGSLYASDNLHPTPRGHSLLAQGALEAALSVPLTVDQIADLSLYPPKGTLGPNLRQRTVPTYPYQVKLTDEYVGCGGSGARSVVLPDATLAGPGSGYVQQVTVKDEAGNSGAGNITVSCLGSQKIDGASTVVLSANYVAKTFVSTGLGWAVV